MSKGGRPRNYSTGGIVNLTDYGLTKQDSHRAQKVFEHEIAEIMGISQGRVSQVIRNLLGANIFLKDKQRMAKIGELIKQEQEAGRLSKRGKTVKSSTGGTFNLTDYGLTKQDSHRAQKVFEHEIAEVMGISRRRVNQVVINLLGTSRFITDKARVKDAIEAILKVPQVGGGGTLPMPENGTTGA